MSAVVDALLRDFLLWLEREPRSYPDVMDAWRTSCPRLPVWEEANERGFVDRLRADGEVMIKVSHAGQGFLSSQA
jgi:hypothetical protein